MTDPIPSVARPSESSAALVACPYCKHDLLSHTVERGCDCGCDNVPPITTHEYEPVPPREQGEHPPCRVCGRPFSEHAKASEVRTVTQPKADGS